MKAIAAAASLVGVPILCVAAYWASGLLLRSGNQPPGGGGRLIVAGGITYSVIGILVFLVALVRKDPDAHLTGLFWPVLLIFDLPRSVREWWETARAEQERQEKRRVAEVRLRRTRGVQLSTERSAALSAVRESSSNIAELSRQIPREAVRVAADAVIHRQNAYIEDIEDLLYLAEWLSMQAGDLQGRVKQDQTREKVKFVLQRIQQIDSEIGRTRDFLVDSEASLLAVIATQDELATSRWFADYSRQFEKHYVLARDLRDEVALVRDEYGD